MASPGVVTEMKWNSESKPILQVCILYGGKQNHIKCKKDNKPAINQDSYELCLL